MDSGSSEKAFYEVPTVTSVDAREILAAIGPAQGLSSEVSSPGTGGPDGLGGIVESGSPRHLGRR